MSIATIMPSPNFQGLLNGKPVAGGLLYTYLAGTLIQLHTWKDANQVTLNTNPIVLDAEGKASVFLDSAYSYKFNLTTAAGAIVPPYPVDNILPTNTASSAFDMPWLELGGESLSPITATSYPSGATYDKCHAGSSLLKFDANQITVTLALTGMLQSNAGGLVSLCLVNLTTNPNTPIATITSTSTTGEEVTSGPITLPAGGITYTYGLKAKVASGAGFGWLARLGKA